MTRFTALIDGKTGAYGVVFPDLPGCTAMGRTLDETLTNAAAALRDWAEVVAARGGAAPKSRPVEAIRTDPEVAQALAAGASLASVPLVRETGKPVKANLSLDSGVLEAMDAAAERLGVTRSALVELMAKRQLSELV
jgi:predicted RNase H-like HicB family nuclease